MRSCSLKLVTGSIPNSGKTNGYTVKKIADLAPRLLATIPKRTVNSRTVSEASTNRKWIADIKGLSQWVC